MKKTYPIDRMCQLLEVKRSSYYNWAKKKKDDDIYPLHSEMLDWVKKIAKGVENLYGSRRMKHAMNCLGFAISRQKARKLMNEAGV